MFNMKNFLLIISFCLSICVSSCDGQDRIYKSPENTLKDTNILESFRENITYIPETYSEIVTDTILSNGNTIHIKYYTNMNDVISVQTKIDTINHIKKYRTFNADVNVNINGKPVFNHTINKAFLKQSEKIDKTNLDDTYLRTFWIESFDKQYNNTPIIHFEYYAPKTKNSIVYKFIVFENSYTIEQITNT